jgi:type VII secretion integral membrane protein EccD
VPAPTSGLARVTIRAPRRRLDLAIPHQVPLVELLPEVLRRAGEGSRENPPGGWMLRRGDGASLLGESALAHQGVRDGDVLYLVPRNLSWPEPEYDDIVEEIAAGARQHGRAWGPAATRLFALIAAGLVLLGGLGVLVTTGSDRATGGLVAGAVAVILLGLGGLLSRAWGDGVAGTAAAGYALPYAAASGALLLAGTGPAADQVLVGSAALLLASVVGAVAVGTGPRVFGAGLTAGGFGMLAALLGLVLPGAGAAAIAIVALVGGIGLAPLLAVRLGKLPLPVLTAAPDVLAAERRPDPPRVLAAVVRADEILAGCLLGIALASVGCVTVLAANSGISGPLLAGLASAALVLRARLFPHVAARLPLLAGGVLGLVVTGWAWFAAVDPALRLVGVAAGFVAVGALFATAATAHRRSSGGSPYLGRLADLADIATVVALAPVACGVLDLYAWVGTLMT